MRNPALMAIKGLWLENSHLGPLKNFKQRIEKK
jgi:hypothetical protein